MSYENLLVEDANGLLYLTINRPKALNALNAATLGELERFFTDDYRQHGQFHGIILTGAGDRAFVAGADIKEFLGIAEQGDGEKMARRGHDIFFLIENFHRPVVALVDGYALGGGCELAMACHLRVATQQARFGQPEVNLGIIPGYGGTQRLNQYIGKGKATELILTGNPIDATEAHRLGLVNYVLPDRETARSKAEELLQTIGAKGPLAIRESIRAINAYYANEHGYGTEARAFGDTTKTADFREGAAAFVEKRKANFRGE
ncbi:enoyl-CoA hydratase/isomerase family protein [Lewinella sp. JB7]|uniref:enoyl-CoA hydratase/isomerase family protein n=1 Tax=Lewinella sp. JB7 TaxID=2962887 RepID=UPI0020C94A37|nr:enoyl-CoA hydratase-related protein [Lewinella sp. JB7]MCP9235431.1 enoyl-CoA hydratase-related protein [Lewinella sp. JB7]